MARLKARGKKIKHYHKRFRNMSAISAMKTAVRKFYTSMRDTNVSIGVLQQDLNTCKSQIDKLASRQIIHANKAARLKSRMNKNFKSARSDSDKQSPSHNSKQKASPSSKNKIAEQKV